MRTRDLVDASRVLATNATRAPRRDELVDQREAQA